MGAGPPQILAESAGAIGKTVATITAQIGTDGLDTKYYFQYGETTAYGTTTPEPDGDAGSGAEPATVEAKLTGLKPSTHYHFRVVAVNEAGEPVVGSDQEFTTLPPLAISDETAMSVASTSATLHAEINPLGSDTHYYFEYGSSSCTDNPGTCQIVPSATGIDIGSGEANQSADVNLEGLTPNTTYYFRVVGTNVLGTIAEATKSFTTYPPEAPFSLPDHRAYELVSPTDTNGGDVGTGLRPAANGHAAADGSAITYTSFSIFSEPQSGDIITQYLSTRGASGWSTKALVPPMQPSASAIIVEPYQFFTSDLTSAVLAWSNTQLTSEAIPQFDNLYVRQTNSGTYQLITKVPPLSTSPESYTVRFAGATPDLSHILFETNDPLAPGVPGNAVSLYEWNEGAIRLVSVLPVPANTPAGSGGAGDGSQTNLVNVISDDGERIFWTDNNEQLYVRESGENSPTTIKLNASQRTPSLGDGSAQFKAATPSGEQVFFTDSTPLTQATSDNGGLYEYSFETRRLTDLTPDPTGNPGVEGLVGVSEDGSILYFVASAKLAAGATVGSPNLYVARSGEITFIATLATEDSADWTENLDNRTAEVTPDGGSLVFLSDASLTGYDNTDAITGSKDSEVFLYSEATGLTCVSCNPSGERPIGNATVPTGVNASYQPRYLAADGSRVFFDTADALVPRDTNNKQDVYEWEHGTVYLISSGTSDDISTFVDSSVNGDDAFFTTRSQLVPQDQDENSAMYDARVNGGFPNELPSAAPCSDEACQGPLSAPPTPPNAATAAFVAPAEDMEQRKSPHGKLARTHKQPPKHKKRHKKRHRQRTMRAKQRKARHRA
jgi:hypothetical protein